MNLSTAIRNLTTALPSLTNKVTPEILILTSEHENRTFMQPIEPHAESVSFILIPLLIVLGVALVSGLAIHCIQKRQRLDNLRHTLIPMYTFTRADEDEWGVLLDNRNNDYRHDGSD